MMERTKKKKQLLNKTVKMGFKQLKGVKWNFWGVEALSLSFPGGLTLPLRLNEGIEHPFPYRPFYVIV